MSSHPIVPARVRLEIIDWPVHAPRGAVTTFCLEHGISRKTFYAVRKQAISDGPNAALEPRSRKPHFSPTRLDQGVKAQALSIRAGMEREGLDHGPISVHDRMRALGLFAPSTATLSRIFRAAGVARAEPKKKPRSSWQRFVYPQPNSCWQLDATDYVLAGGRKCVIFQLTDDHSRKAIASLVASGETSEAAIRVFKLGITRFGVPQRLLTDNGTALNPSRRGVVGELFLFVTELGVAAITGKPGKPTTQGKNERFHQTLFRWLRVRPLAHSMEELQALVDEFDEIYNTRRPHQALPGRITPDEAWNLTATATPPVPDQDYIDALKATKQRRHHTTPNGAQVYQVDKNGAIRTREITFNLGKPHANTTVLVIAHDEGIIVVDQAGTLILESGWPPAGVTYVGIKNRKLPRTGEVLPMS